MTQTYGRIFWTDQNQSFEDRPHRVAWILANGPIPDGYEIDHNSTCPKSCVTADHLQCLSKSDHAILGWQRGELNGGWGTARKRIHPPKPEAFIWQIERICKQCSISFMPSTARQIHCSESCKNKFKDTKRAPSRYPKRDPSPCPECGIIFQPKRSDSTFCSRECIIANRDKKRSITTYSIICAWCGEKKQVKVKTSETCSRQCAGFLRHARDRENFMNQIPDKEGVSDVLTDVGDFLFESRKRKNE